MIEEVNKTAFARAESGEDLFATYIYRSELPMTARQFAKELEDVWNKWKYPFVSPAFKRMNEDGTMWKVRIKKYAPVKRRYF